MSYPTDPAALFMELYDQLPDDVFLADKAVQWDNEDAWVTLHAMRVYDQILTYGEADPVQIERIVKEGDDRGIFTVLRGIDWALAHINPFSNIYEHENLEWLAIRYAETGRLNNGPAEEGALLPRGTYPAGREGRAVKRCTSAYTGLPVNRGRKSSSRYCLTRASRQNLGRASISRLVARHCWKHSMMSNSTFKSDIRPSSSGSDQSVRDRYVTAS